MINKYLTQIEDKLNLYFGKKAPALPENIKEFIVKYAPYLLILVLIMCLPSLFLAFGLSSLLSPFMPAGVFHPVYSFSFYSLITLSAMILELIALPGLFKRAKKSWKYMFYASLLSLLSSIFSLKFGEALISALLSFYVLFQIRSYYKN